ncbi:MAG TPA: hypothetical protein G4N95_00950 [Anaerolineae bacterium]|nr:hypothetical protein [Anaerolineae bacterium]
MKKRKRIIPIYTSRGDVGALLVYPWIHNLQGEWIGWVTSTGEVYSVLGNYVGWLSKDPRILRRRSYDFSKPRLKPPPQPKKIRPPATLPLAPLMPMLTYATIDVLLDEPEKLSTPDSDDLREDMD